MTHVFMRDTRCPVDGEGVWEAGEGGGDTCLSKNTKV